MKKPPISVIRDFYRGSNAQKCAKAAQTNAIATKLDQAINSILARQTHPIQSYTYQEISPLTGYPYETVRELCFEIDSGHNGFTIIRRDISIEEAMDHFYKNEESNNE